MTIEKLIEKAKMEYKEIDAENNYKIIKIADKMNLLYLYCESDQFILNRDLFEYLDKNKLSYVIVLQNIIKKRWYYLQLRKENNWLKSCFETCDKEDLYLGKQVMNATISENNLCIKLQEIK